MNITNKVGAAKSSECLFTKTVESIKQYEHDDLELWVASDIITKS